MELLERLDGYIREHESRRFLQGQVLIGGVLAVLLLVVGVVTGNVVAVLFGLLLALPTWALLFRWARQMDAGV